MAVRYDLRNKALFWSSIGTANCAASLTGKKVSEIISSVLNDLLTNAGVPVTAIQPILRPGKASIFEKPFKVMTSGAPLFAGRANLLAVNTNGLKTSSERMANPFRVAMSD